MLTVRSASGQAVALSELVQAMPTQREKTVYHKDLLPVAYVLGDMAGTLDSPLYGMFQMRGKLAGMPLPEGGKLGEYFISQPKDRYRGYSFKWDGEWQVTYETFRDMGIAYAVGLILIYLLVVAQFRSYLTPLIIMAPIPLTIIGVMPGHALLGRLAEGLLDIDVFTGGERVHHHLVVPVLGRRNQHRLHRHYRLRH